MVGKARSTDYADGHRCKGWGERGRSEIEPAMGGRDLVHSEAKAPYVTHPTGSIEPDTWNVIDDAGAILSCKQTVRFYIDLQLNGESFYSWHKTFDISTKRNICSFKQGYNLRICNIASISMINSWVTGFHQRIIAVSSSLSLHLESKEI